VSLTPAANLPPVSINVSLRKDVSRGFGDAGRCTLDSKLFVNFQKILNGANANIGVLGEAK
jgi:hypothetical protein